MKYRQKIVSEPEMTMLVLFYGSTIWTPIFSIEIEALVSYLFASSIHVFF